MKSEISNSKLNRQAFFFYPSKIFSKNAYSATERGITYNKEEIEYIILFEIEASPIKRVIINASVLEWKEHEIEIIYTGDLY